MSPFLSLCDPLLCPCALPTMSPYHPLCPLSHPHASPPVSLHPLSSCVLHIPMPSWPCPHTHSLQPQTLSLTSLCCPQVLLRYYPTLTKAVGSSEKIFEFLDREPQVAPSGTLAPSDLRGHLQLEDVWFSYPGRQEPVLKVDMGTQQGDTDVMAEHGRRGDTAGGHRDMMGECGRCGDTAKET